MLLYPVFFEVISLPGEKTLGICNLVMCPSVQAANDDARWPSSLLERVPACLRDGDGGVRGGREAHFLGLVPSNRTLHSLDRERGRVYNCPGHVRSKLYRKLVRASVASCRTTAGA